jgi:hypothetical protein
LSDASKDDGIKLNVEKAEYMLLAHHQNTGQNRDIHTANRNKQKTNSVAFSPPANYTD